MNTKKVLIYVAVAGLAYVVLRSAIATGSNKAATSAPIDNGGPIIDPASGTSAPAGPITPFATSDNNTGGIFGVLGTVTNDVLGGAPQAFGTWLGERISGNDPEGGASLNFQTRTGNPYAPGTSAGYANAVDNSPTNQQYAASPFTVTPAASTVVVDDSGTTTTFA